MGRVSSQSVDSRRPVAWLVLLTVFFWWRVGDQAAIAAEGPIVDAIELRLEGRLGRKVDLGRALAFAPGDLLTEAAVRRTLDNLYATGVVAEASVVRRPSEPPAEGVMAVVVARAFVWVERVRFEGRLGLSKRDLRALVTQRPGAPFSAKAVAESRRALVERYRVAGFRRSVVAVHHQPQPGHRMDVVFDIDSGPRAHIGEVRFAGDLGPWSAPALEARLLGRSGRPYRRPAVGGDAARLRTWLAGQGYAQARVKAPVEIYDPVEDRVNLTYAVTIGPRVDVEVKGTTLALLRRRGLVPFVTEGAYDAAQLRRACTAIRTDFQGRGHHAVEVTCTEQARDAGTNDRTLAVRIVVDPGPVYELTDVSFIGNAAFDEATLTPLMATSARRPWPRGGGQLVTSELVEDIDNVRSYYVLQGFADATVGPPRVIEDTTAVPPALAVEIPIVEGARWRVVGLRVDDGGVLVADPAAATAPPLVAGGGPFHPVLLEESRNRLRTRYEAVGYADVTTKPTLDWDASGMLVDVDMAVEPGARSTVDRVILRGAYRVRNAAIRRAVGLRPGDPISRRRLLELERDLYRLGVFTRVDVSLGPSGPDGRRDVTIELDEGRPWRIGYGLGYHSEDEIGGLFSLSRLNPLRRAGRLQLDMRANRNDQRYRLLFDQPSIGARGLGLTYTLFFQLEDREAFVVTDRGAQVALRKELGRSRYALVFDYRLVDLTGIVPALGFIDREEQAVQVASLTPNLFIDRRDDPFDPNQGWSTYVQIERAFGLAEADTRFVKLFWQQTAFLPFGRWGTLAGSLRLGGIEPLDERAVPDPLVPAGLASALVPISERFFAGGRTSHRAYERDQLGLPGVTLIDFSGADAETPTFAEIGGNGLALLNLDYRFPIAGSVGGTVFVDAGNVWADWRDIDVDEARLGVGLGVRYRSPIGPLRLELGWKLDPEPGQRNPVILLSFGNPF